jgi:hypothetical protein
MSGLAAQKADAFQYYDIQRTRNVHLSTIKEKKEATMKRSNQVSVALIVISLLLVACQSRPERPENYVETLNSLYISFPKTNRFARITYDSSGLQTVLIGDTNYVATDIVASVDFDTRTGAVTIVRNTIDTVTYRQYYRTNGRLDRIDTLIHDTADHRLVPSWEFEVH